jgi:hypothetical protein
MRAGISIAVNAADRERLAAVVADGNSLTPSRVSAVPAVINTPNGAIPE